MSRARLALFAFLVACGGGTTTDETSDTGDTGVDAPPLPALPLEAAAPYAGAAEGTLKIPVGTPLAGFTSRCGCLGGTSKQDDRDSNYSKAFIESTGVHIRPTIKAIWIESGDNHLVLTKTDSIYSFDGLVEAVTARLEEETGEELSGMVTHMANHNHSSYGTFSKHTGFFLGHDKFNQENFDRFVEQITAVALEAYENRVPAKLGMGTMTDWDPNNRVYSDRRGINNDLKVFDDMGPEQGGKDPHLTVLRVDTADDEPIAVMMQWGMHPFVFGEGSPLATADATSLVEAEVSEAFDSKVVSMFVQGSGGDASVRGSDSGWARMETVGQYAKDKILALREATPTTGDPIVLETSHKKVPLRRDDIRVTRNGTVDWYFPPLDVSNEDYIPDEIVWNEDGTLASPIDEFHTNEGAVFCGSGDFDLPVGGFNTEVDPYGTCMQVEFMSILLETFFRLDPEQMEFPLDGMSQTLAAASMISGIPVLRAGSPGATDGEVVDKTDVLLGFVPGEALHFYTEWWRHQVRDRFDIEDTMLVAYAMDHYGYLLIMEDWMLGEYEADITFWGPIGGEHLMESLFDHVEKEQMTKDADEQWEDRFHGTEHYPDWPFENDIPDTTANAGTRLTNETVPEYYWIPDGFDLDLDIPAEVPRLSAPLQIGWIGGDPGVDVPRVTLERNEGTEGSPDWQPVKSHAGRIINDDHHDFAIGHTPDPLFPASMPQTHYRWATWQPVGHIRDRAGLPVGSYRIKVEGQKFVPGDTEYPWDSEPYSFTTEAFEVVPAEVTLTAPSGGVVWASLKASSKGFRLVDIDGSSKGDNPLRGQLAVTWNTQESGAVASWVDAPAPENKRSRLTAPAGETVLGVRVVDAYGNEGSWGDVPVIEPPEEPGDSGDTGN